MTLKLNLAASLLVAMTWSTNSFAQQPQAAQPAPDTDHPPDPTPPGPAGPAPVEQPAAPIPDAPGAALPAGVPRPLPAGETSPNPAAAQPFGVGHGEPGVGVADLGIGLGTTGIGIQARLPLSPARGLYGRIGANVLPHYGFSRNTTQVHYDLRASLRTIDALLDWHPAGNGFRLSAGVIFNDNRVDGIGTPNRVVNLAVGGTTYSSTDAGHLDGRIDFASVAPYVGIGWETPVPAWHGWHVSSDLGVMYQGSPKTRLGIADCRLPAALCSLVANALIPTIATETQRLNDDLKDYRFFPVLRIGVNYRF